MLSVVGWVLLVLRKDFFVISVCRFGWKLRSEMHRKFSNHSQARFFLTLVSLAKMTFSATRNKLTILVVLTESVFPTNKNWGYSVPRVEKITSFFLLPYKSDALEIMIWCTTITVVRTVVAFFRCCKCIYSNSLFISIEKMIPMPACF